MPRGKFSTYKADKLGWSYQDSGSEDHFVKQVQESMGNKVSSSGHSYVHWPQKP